MKSIAALQIDDYIVCKNIEEQEKIIKLFKNLNYFIDPELDNTHLYLVVMRHSNEYCELSGAIGKYWYFKKRYEASEFLEEEFPEKWCIKTHRQEFFTWFNKQPNINKGRCYPYNYDVDRFWHYPSFSKNNCSYVTINKEPNYTEITFEQFEKKFLKQEETNKMKTTRLKLLSIRGKDSCSEFNQIIDSELKQNFQLKDEEEFVISQNGINQIPRANHKQKDLLKSIGLIKELDLFSITTYEEVCKALNEQQIKEITLHTTNDLNTTKVNIKKLVALTKLDQIERLFNQDWKKDWTNLEQRKYHPYFEKKFCGWVLFSVGGLSACSCGSVVYFRDEKTAKYVGETFIDIYKDILE